MPGIIKFKTDAGCQVCPLAAQPKIWYWRKMAWNFFGVLQGIRWRNGLTAFWQVFIEVFAVLFLNYSRILQNKRGDVSGGGSAIDFSGKTLLYQNGQHATVVSMRMRQNYGTNTGSIKWQLAVSQISNIALTLE